MESFLYEGIVRHERLTPVPHRFDYRLFLAYLDLAELPALAEAGLISASRFGTASFRRGDHLGTGGESLDRVVRDVVAARTGFEPTGPIRALTQLRVMGYWFSPLTLFYCFAEDGRSVEAVVAEVQNTPWRERHAYVLWDGTREGDDGHRHAKEFHVSPFMSMDLQYRWRVPTPGETLSLEIENVAASGMMFRAGLLLSRRELTRSSLNRLLLRYPLQPLRITAAIYYQAFQLWRKRCPYFPHPKGCPPRPEPAGGVAGSDGAKAVSSGV